jgi:CRISPR-associated exonuclease Cas4
MLADADPIPISALEHYRYCARQSALILVDGVWVENAHTARGQYTHRRADTPGGRIERGRRVERAVPLWSEQWGLSGRADAVEILGDGTVVPVEYKAGRRHGDTADVQLCAEAMCLEEMLRQPVGYGYVWYGATRRRMRVSFSDTLRDLTVETIRAVHRLRAEAKLPPAPADERCEQCQLAGHCLPGLVADPQIVVRFIAGEVLACGS